MLNSILFLLLTGSVGFTADCERLDFHYFEKLQATKKTIEICKLDGKLVSRDCAEKKCGLLTRKTDIKMSNPIIGNPAARVCFEMGAIPMSGQLKRGDKVVYPNKSLCFTRSMRSFVEVQLLFPPPDNPFL